LLSRLSHPNVASLLGAAIVSSKQGMLVMDRFECSLKEAIFEPKVAASSPRPDFLIELGGNQASQLWSLQASLYSLTPIVPLL
jgi:hypothetical protein